MIIFSQVTETFQARNVASILAKDFMKFVLEVVSFISPGEDIQFLGDRSGKTLKYKIIQHLLMILGR